MDMTDDGCRTSKESGKNGATLPFSMTISAAQSFTGLSRSEIYRRLSAGDIAAVKAGSRTLVLTESLCDYLSALPTATFRKPQVSA